MTVRHTYSCNLCGDQISETGRTGVGVLFGTSVLTFRALAHSNHHLCDQCVQGVVNAHRLLNDRPQDKLS